MNSGTRGPPLSPVGREVRAPGLPHWGSVYMWPSMVPMLPYLPLAGPGTFGWGWGLGLGLPWGVTGHGQWLLWWGRRHLVRVGGLGDFVTRGPSAGSGCSKAPP